MALSNNKCFSIDKLKYFREILIEMAAKNLVKTYLVPKFVVDIDSHRNLVDVGCPYMFFAEIIDRILMIGEQTETNDNDMGVFYSSFIRTFSALNGEIGTALKQIAFLPFLKLKLGVKNIVFLPTSEIGITNKKGQRGSPFAVRDPFNIDASIGDPLLPEISAVDQYRFLISACTVLNIHAGSIVPLTTLSIDSPLFVKEPSLGYWWNKNADAKRLSEKECLSKFEQERDTKFSALFRSPPTQNEIQLTQLNTGEYITAKTKGLSLVNALPDPISGDPSTYTWGDVASIRYTLGTIPPSQGTLQNVVWDYSLPSFQLMPEIINWRVEKLGEKIFVLDVCSSLPNEVLRCVRGSGRKFIAEQLWDFDTRGKELDGVIGPLVFSAGANWFDPTALCRSLKMCLEQLKSNPPDKVFFAGISNHDTKPPPPEIVIGFWAATWLLPRSVPFIFSGIEHGSVKVVNKEFGFSKQEMLDMTDDDLALFNDNIIDWETLVNAPDLTVTARELLKLRAEAINFLGLFPFLDQIERFDNTISYKLISESNVAKYIRILFNCGPTIFCTPIFKNEQVIGQFGYTKPRKIYKEHLMIPNNHTAIISSHKLREGYD